MRDGVQAVIERHADVEGDPPERTFHLLSSRGFLDNTKELSVPAPGNVFGDADVFDALYAGEFEEPARQIYEHLPQSSADEPGSDENAIESIERGLFEFVGVVLNYTGRWEFDEVAFRLAFEEQFEPRLTDRETTKFILCLKNTSIEPALSIDLATDIHGEPEYLGPYAIETLQIRPADDLEETGIASREAPGTPVVETIDSLDYGLTNPVLEIVLHRRRPYSEIVGGTDLSHIFRPGRPHFDATPADVHPWEELTELVRFLATGIRRCLRLLDPEGTPGYERGYHLTPGWETYRGISTPVNFTLDFDCPVASASTYLDADRRSKITQLWDAHRNRLCDGGTSFRSPLSRFERMFSRESLEDQIVDCAIGCETTLLKGGSPGGNRYRLGVRAAVLIGDDNSRDWSPLLVSRFLRTLYDYRNKVVHDDASLPAEPADDEWISVDDMNFLAGTFAQRARELYADIIREYMLLSEQQDMSIHDLNKQIDAGVLRQGGEIRELLF
ncbi:HEPN domain-containing protein [Salinarchaeum laminariae]|uniref:HEPN domain-containing protein n=1 Tax=Salinarchaeum laminariae TaxID=869888 RepID=UPI0020C09AE9|nr:HEPN domain-containing protein [Salinarchaeum laminariae]